MFCIRCGKQNVPSATFCYNCGTRLVRGEQPETQPVSSDGTGITSAGENPSPGASATEGSGQTPVAAVQETPPSNPADPQNWPNYNNPPPNSGPRWPGTPPGWNKPPQSSYPGYGYRVPPPGQVPLAPNGLPLPVFSNPENFYSYTNKEGKKVYAALSPFGLRAGAVLIDTFLIYTISSIFSTILLIALNQLDLNALANANANTISEQPVLPPWLFLLIQTSYLAYCTLMLWLAKGQTLGKRIVGIKVIKLDGSRLDFRTALLRSSFGFSWPLGQILAPYGEIFVILNFCLSIMVMIGFTSAFWDRDRRRRGWHDKLADTIVVRSNELVQGVNY